MAAPKKKTGKLVCPKKAKVGARTFKVSATGGQCFVKRKDGTKAAVKKAPRGTKFGQFVKKKRAPKKTDMPLPEPRRAVMRRGGGLTPSEIDRYYPGFVPNVAWSS